MCQLIPWPICLLLDIVIFKNRNAIKDYVFSYSNLKMLQCFICVLKSQTFSEGQSPPTSLPVISFMSCHLFHYSSIKSTFCFTFKENNFEKYVYPLLCFLAPKPGYSQGVTSYTQSQQTRQVTVIKPAAPSPASSTFSIYPVTSTVQPVAAAASVVPSYSQSPTYSTNAVTYSGKI